MSPETTKYDGVEPLARARRATAIAKHLALVGIHLRSLNTEVHSDRCLSDRAALLTSEYGVEHIFRRQEEEQAEYLNVRVSFYVGAQDEEDNLKLFTMRASLEVRYEVEGHLSEQDRKNIAAFTTVNSVVHAWPYYRELVQSTAARMGLPPITVPLFRADEISTETDTKRESERERAEGKKKR